MRGRSDIGLAALILLYRKKYSLKYNRMPILATGTYDGRMHYIFFSSLFPVGEDTNRGGLRYNQMVICRHPARTSYEQCPYRPQEVRCCNNEIHPNDYTPAHIGNRLYLCTHKLLSLTKTYYHATATIRLCFFL